MLRLKRALKSVANKPARIRAILIIIVLLVLVYFRKVLYLRYYARVYLDRDAIIKQESRDFTASIVKYTSKCKCRENVTVTLVKTSKTYVIEIEDKQQNASESINKSYIISRKEFEQSIFTCDMYNTLRRGPNQRVISFSLYGQDRNYYNRIKLLLVVIRKLYPGWIVRIGHDSTIDTSFICEMECLTYEGSYLDIVDFCDMERLPIDPVNTLNVSYMHGMTYRWIPMGDSFIDFVGSRDTDAWMSQRERDSVDVWLNSNTIFHVMRDDPMHNIPIVGGYWGFANSRDRQLSKHLFKILTNRFIAEYFNPGDKNLKGHDQFLLTEFFSPYSLKNSTTHDAFTCDQINGDPWPTKRPYIYCFVGCSFCCDQPDYVKKVPYNKICPVSCRPKNHKDWIYC